MAHRAGQNRQQLGLFATPLDEMIAPDNIVRVIEDFEYDSQKDVYICPVGEEQTTNGTIGL